MARFVLKHHGAEPRDSDIELIKRSAGIEILDHSLPQAMLVDAPEQTARELREQLPDWTVAEEVVYPPPGPVEDEVRGGDSD